MLENKVYMLTIIKYLLIYFYIILRPKTPRYAGSSKKAKPLNKLKKGFLCEITSCLDSKSIHKGTQ